MTLDELLSSENSELECMQEYFKTVGLKHVRRKELDKIIEKYGLVVFKMTCFSEIYKIVLERETSRRMHNWTLIIGVMTIVYTVMTFLMLMKT